MNIHSQQERNGSKGILNKGANSCPRLADDKDIKRRKANE